MSFKTIDFKDGKVILLDQRHLPEKEVYLELENYEQVAEAIEDMAIRGAPAIGIAGAFGLALCALSLQQVYEPEQWWKEFERAEKRLAQTRPTAVNLFWALSRIKKLASTLLGMDPAERARKILEEARAILEEDIRINRKMGELGAGLINDGDTILTHCNAGALATGGYGTALGVIRFAWEQGKKIKVLADETRPRLQGARLTCWELEKEGIPVKLICDDMAGWAMSRGMVDKIFVGADRIARNGDVANKIGTYSLAVLANYHKVPFYVVAPLSTIDLNCKSGAEIPIEERSESEVKEINGKKIAPPKTPCWNPAFDVTPAKLITAIITEKGIIKEPDEEKIKNLLG